jgi:hypothetical protein
MCPTLGENVMEEFKPDPPLNAEQRARVAMLTAKEVEDIDAMLLSNVTERWRKVAMVTGMVMTQAETREFGLPDIYYAERIRELAAKGAIESAGNLNHMRYTEIRLPT